MMATICLASRMDKETSIIDRIRQLEPGSQITFKNGSWGSIRALVTRVKVEAKRKREFATRKLAANVVVCRIK